MSTPTRRPRRSPASTWPAWSDEGRWTFGPASPHRDDPDEGPVGRLVCSCGRVLVNYDTLGPDQVADAACGSCGAAERATFDRPSAVPLTPSADPESPPF